MNSTLGGKLSSFSPVTFYPDSEITIIRPLVYLREKTIISFTRKENFPIQTNPCPLDKKTKRQEMKNILAQMEKNIPNCGNNLISAIKNQWMEK
ncbi:MAG: hypothetical protein AAGU27_28450 [Dehalobacterium sp.]